MILVDLNQVLISTIMVSIGPKNLEKIQDDTEDMFRHIFLNSIRSNRLKFGSEYGEMVLCADDKNYWRKDFFPYYKANRKKNREESKLDWNRIFQFINNVRDEVKEFLPYNVIQVNKAEADDIIGTLCHTYGTYMSNGEPILILSGDKDYIQLHKYANVKQFDPTRKKWVYTLNPEEYMFEHIIKGDVGDGIPNVLSDDNSLVMGIRQRPITKKRIDAWKKESPKTGEESLKTKYLRNETLIDLSKVPEDIQNEILEMFENRQKKSREKMLPYFMEKKLKNLTEHISEF